MTAPKPGIYREVPEDEYHGWDVCSYSRLKVLATRTPAHLRHQLDNPRQTPQMQVGTAVHRLVLEGRAAYAASFAIGGPVNEKTGRPYGVETKAFAEWEAAQGKPVLSVEQADSVEAIAAAVLRSQSALMLLDSCAERELSMVAMLHGQPVKARADGYGEGILLDIKVTGRGAGPVEFERTVGTMGYGIQSAVYDAVARAAGLAVSDFVFVVVEDQPPYGVGLYRMEQEVIDLYQQRLPVLLERYGDCVASGRWPCWPDEVVDVGVPAWMRRRLAEEAEEAAGRGASPVAPDLDWF